MVSVFDLRIELAAHAEQVFRKVGPSRFLSAQHLHLPIRFSSQISLFRKGKQLRLNMLRKRDPLHNSRNE